MKNIPKNRRQNRLKSIPHPKQIKAHLDTCIIGQEIPKRRLAVAVTNHYCRVNNVRQVIDPELAKATIEKSNVLLLGPTGCGKTLLVRMLAEILNVPLSIGDATSLTEAGYVGQDVETLLTGLIQAADGDTKAAEKGIIYIDEIDKIRKTGENVSTTRDVGGEGVQQALLKMIEGNAVNVSENKSSRLHPMEGTMPIDTTNVLFICGGAFVGLEEIIASRLSVSDKGDILSRVLPQDLVKFGLIPELVGRLPVLTTLTGLTETDLEGILVKPKNALLKQYRKLCQQQGYDVVFTHSAVKAIASAASKLKVGARALRSVVETVMLDIQFAATPGYRYEIDQDVVAGRKQAKGSKI